MEWWTGEWMRMRMKSLLWDSIETIFRFLNRNLGKNWFDRYISKLIHSKRLRNRLRFEKNNLSMKAFSIVVNSRTNVWFQWWIDAELFSLTHPKMDNYACVCVCIRLCMCYRIASDLVKVKKVTPSSSSSSWAIYIIFSHKIIEMTIVNVYAKREIANNEFEIWKWLFSSCILSFISQCLSVQTQKKTKHHKNSIKYLIILYFFWSPRWMKHNWGKIDNKSPYFYSSFLWKMNEQKERNGMKVKLAALAVSLKREWMKNLKHINLFRLLFNKKKLQFLFCSYVCIHIICI